MIKCEGKDFSIKYDISIKYDDEELTIFSEQGFISMQKQFMIRKINQKCRGVNIIQKQRMPTRSLHMQLENKIM